MTRKNTKEIIKTYFLDNPTAKLRVREIERTVHTSLPSTIRFCKDLEQEHILTIIKIGTVKFYTANKMSPQYLLEKRLHNIKQIYNSGLIDYLNQEFSNPVLILFGSFAKGEDIEESDIDIYLETPSKKKINIEKFEKQLKKQIQLFQQKEIREIKNKNLVNNILNGITINKQIEVFK